MYTIVQFVYKYISFFQLISFVFGKENSSDLFISMFCSKCAKYNHYFSYAYVFYIYIFLYTYIFLYICIVLYMYMIRWQDGFDTNWMSYFCRINFTKLIHFDHSATFRLCSLSKIYVPIRLSLFTFWKLTEFLIIFVKLITDKLIKFFDWIMHRFCIHFILLRFQLKWMNQHWY